LGHGKDRTTTRGSCYIRNEIGWWEVLKERLAGKISIDRNKGEGKCEGVSIPEKFSGEEVGVNHQERKGIGGCFVGEWKGKTKQGGGGQGGTRETGGKRGKVFAI